MSNNHARDDFYQPGQLLPPPDPTTSTSTGPMAVTAGTFYPTTWWGWLAISYTPPVNCWMLYHARCSAAHSIAETGIALALYKSAPAPAAYLAISGWNHAHLAYYSGVECTISYFAYLPKGVTTTVQPYIIFNANGLGYIYAGEITSRFEAIPFAAP